jgi:hypothetical protein
MYFLNFNNLKKVGHKRRSYLGKDGKDGKDFDFILGGSGISFVMYGDDSRDVSVELEREFDLDVCGVTYIHFYNIINNIFVNTFYNIIYFQRIIHYFQKFRY